MQSVSQGNKNNKIIFFFRLVLFLNCAFSICQALEWLCHPHWNTQTLFWGMDCHRFFQKCECELEFDWKCKDLVFMLHWKWYTFIDVCYIENDTHFVDVTTDISFSDVFIVSWLCSISAIGRKYLRNTWEMLEVWCKRCVDVGVWVMSGCCYCKDEMPGMLLLSGCSVMPHVLLL